MARSRYKSGRAEKNLIAASTVIFLSSGFLGGSLMNAIFQCLGRNGFNTGPDSCSNSPVFWDTVNFYSFHQFLLFPSRNAFAITDTELKLIAAAANTGLNKIPKNGKRTPAATGTPRAL